MTDREPVVSVYETAGSVRQAISARRVDLLTVSSLLYLTMPESTLVRPRYVGVRPGEAENGTTYLLLARAQNAASGLKALRRKSVVIATSGQSRLPRLWLEVLLRKAGLERSRKLLSSVREVGKAPAALLPVFFGQADYCIVTKGGFGTAAEMNPQLGRELKVVAASPRLHPCLVVTRNSWTQSSRDKKLLDDAMLNLHKHPEGRQTMALFGVQRMVPYQPFHLAGVRALLADCRKLGVPINAGN